MRSAIFITVRTDSTRLPNKALLTILDKPTIELVILRAKQVKGVDDIVVCTTNRTIDDEIVKIAEENNVKFFRGSVTDKLDRWLGAIRKYNIDCFATMDGDDLLCDPELIEIGINQISSTDVDFIEAPVGLICGSFTYAIRSSALEKVCLIKGTNDTEMMWTYFRDTGLFKTTTLNIKDPIFYDSEIRMTLDYNEDFIFFKNIFEHFNCIENNIPLRTIVNFLHENPAIAQTNFFRHQEWAANQKRKTNLILK